MRWTRSCDLFCCGITEIPPWQSLARGGQLVHITLEMASNREIWPWAGNQRTANASAAGSVVLLAVIAEDAMVTVTVTVTHSPGRQFQTASCETQGE